jgi:hypothetical protein
VLDHVRSCPLNSREELQPPVPGEAAILYEAPTKVAVMQQHLVHQYLHCSPVDLLCRGEGQQLVRCLTVRLLLACLWSSRPPHQPLYCACGLGRRHRPPLMSLPSLSSTLSPLCGAWVVPLRGLCRSPSPGGAAEPRAELPRRIRRCAQVLRRAATLGGAPCPTSLITTTGRPAPVLTSQCRARGALI